MINQYVLRYLLIPMHLLLQPTNKCTDVSVLIGNHFLRALTRFKFYIFYFQSVFDQNLIFPIMHLYIIVLCTS